ncbi:Uncharacterised protein [Chryseobacterium carnipullorum]|nr:Uncharacterised protein [Chryseobacterium carnipullorum]
MDKPDNKTNFSGYNFQNSRTYVMSFTGNYDCLEAGDIFIETRLNNPNEMAIFYEQDKDGWLNPQKCPNFSTFIPLFPHQKVFLTKQ